VNGTIELKAVQGQRTAPDAVLAQLREIDPRADLMLAAPGVWMLGVWNPSRAATGRANRRLARLARLPVRDRNEDLAARIAMATLAARGWRPVALYEQQEPDSRIVEDFRQRDFNYRHAADATFEARMAEAEIVPRTAGLVIDRLQSEARSIHSKLRFGVSVFQGAARRARSSVRKRIGGSE
jgi:hypothetical protein